MQVKLAFHYPICCISITIGKRSITRSFFSYLPNYQIVNYAMSLLHKMVAKMNLSYYEKSNLPKQNNTIVHLLRCNGERLCFATCFLGGTFGRNLVAGAQKHSSGPKAVTKLSSSCLKVAPKVTHPTTHTHTYTQYGQLVQLLRRNGPKIHLVPNNSDRAPPPFFGQCPKENIF